MSEKKYTDIEKLTMPLEKKDVEFRVGSVKEGAGFSLLAYKTARTDVKRLNEVFGTRWKNRYYLDEGGRQCCEILIYDTGLKEWVGRSDLGTESNTEKEKGSYSDAMKRAGFKWGIGIELYEFPFIWVPWKEFNNKTPKGFFVSKIELAEYDPKTMEMIVKYDGSIIYASKNGNKKPEADASTVITDEQFDQLSDLIMNTNTNVEKFLAYFKVQKLENLEAAKFNQALTMLNKKGANNGTN